MVRTAEPAAASATNKGELKNASAAHQEAYRRECERKRRHEERLEAMARKLRRRTIVEATILFTVFETLLTYFEVERALASVFVGAALGFAWDRMQAGRFTCLWSGLAVHVLFRSCYGFGDAFTALFGALAFACLATGIGTGQETRRRDGGYLR